VGEPTLAAHIQAGAARQKAPEVIVLTGRGARAHPWAGLDPAAVGEGLLAGVEDIAGDELIPEVARQVPQTREIIRADGSACLDLDR
jgi:hypothetical protein